MFVEALPEKCEPNMNVKNEYFAWAMEQKVLMSTIHHGMSGGPLALKEPLQRLGIVAESLQHFVNDHSDMKSWAKKTESAQKLLAAELKGVHSEVQAALVEALAAATTACRDHCQDANTWRKAVKSGDNLDAIAAAAKKKSILTPAFAMKLKTVSAKLSQECLHSLSLSAQVVCVAHRKIAGAVEQAKPFSCQRLFGLVMRRFDDAKTQACIK